MKLIDLGNDYYLAKLKNIQDYDFVLTEGPWMVANHYLTIRRGFPDFQPDEDVINKLEVWVRFPELSIEYFDAPFLMRVGERIGKVIKVDRTTVMAGMHVFALR